MNDTSKIVLAAIAGAAVGAAIGILFAPASGKETRQKISDKINNAKDNLVSKASDLTDAAKEMANEAKAKASKS